MLNHKIRYCLVFCMFCGLVACTQKDIPQGTRISVLPNQNIKNTEVSTTTNTLALGNISVNHHWSQNGGNYSHSYGNLSLGFPISLLWTQDYGASIGKKDIQISEPIVSNKVVYIADAKTHISAFNLVNGDLLWEQKPHFQHKNKSAKITGLATDGEKLFLTTDYGDVASIDVNNGQQIATFSAQIPIKTAPVVYGNNIFVQTIDNHIFALDKNTFKSIWQYEVMQEDTTLLGGANPVFSPEHDILIVAFSNGELQAIKASTGSPLWSNMLVSDAHNISQSTINAIKANPVIDGNVVYALGNSKIFLAIDIITGKKLWNKTISGIHQPIVSGAYIFVLSNDDFLMALNKKNGNIIWSKNISSLKDKDTVALRPLLTDDSLLLSFSDGKIVKINAKNGEIEDTISTEKLSSSPIIAEETLILSTPKAKLLTYKRTK